MSGGHSSYLSGAALILGLVVGWVSPLHAQFITVAAGASSAVPAQGGSISFEGPKFSSYFGAGDLGSSPAAATANFWTRWLNASTT